MDNLERCYAVYHYIRDVNPHNVHAITSAQFVGQVDWITRHYDMVDPEALLDEMDGEALLRKPALLTFDDGLSEHFRMAYALLRQRGLRGIFFPNVEPLVSGRVPMVNQIQVLLGVVGPAGFESGMIERMNAGEREMWTDCKNGGVKTIKRIDRGVVNALKYFLNFQLEWERSREIVDTLFAAHVCDSRTFIADYYLTAGQIREMAAHGMVFGGHTFSHRYLTSASREYKRGDIMRSLDVIRDLTGRDAWTFAYPFGHYDQDSMDALEEANVRLAFTTEPEVKDGHVNRLRQGRFDTVLLPPISKFSAGDLQKNCEVGAC